MTTYDGQQPSCTWLYRCLAKQDSARQHRPCKQWKIEETGQHGRVVEASRRHSFRAHCRIESEKSASSSSNQNPNRNLNCDFNHSLNRNMHWNLGHHPIWSEGERQSNPSHKKTVTTHPLEQVSLQWLDRAWQRDTSLKEEMRACHLPIRWMIKLCQWST